MAAVAARLRLRKVQVPMKLSQLVIYAAVVSSLGVGAANAQITIPTTTAGETASVAALGCQPNCPVQQNSSAGGVSASYGGATAEASASIGVDPAAMASAISVTGTTVGAVASVDYSFAIVPNGQSGAPPPLMFDGLPYLPFSFTSLFTYQSTEQGDSSAASIFSTSNNGLYESIDLSTPNTNLCADGCQEGSNVFYGQPNTPISISVGAGCNLQGIGSCNASADPIVTIGAAYAPYYSVVYNSDLTSVPEPGAAGLILCGIGILAIFGRGREQIRQLFTYSSRC
jgi:hypothetical protein